MTLDPHPNYPNARCYVLKLHRDAQPLNSKTLGRLENITTGRVYHFERSEELLAFLFMDMTTVESNANAAQIS